MILASDSVCHFLDRQPEKDTGTKQLRNISGSLKFENALDNFNLTSQSGERVALVGRSGSGKTTVVNLLPRFVEPSSGNVFIDDTDIADVQLFNLRAQFALVSQDVFLFDDTLFENVRYGRPEAREAEVLMALEAANLLDLVRFNCKSHFERCTNFVVR